MASIPALRYSVQVKGHMEASSADFSPERLHMILDDGEFVLYRRRDATDTPSPSRSLLVVIPRSEHPRPQDGRSRGIDTLLGAFERVVTSGTPGLVPPRGLFASGKFDQYKRDIPWNRSWGT